MKQAMLALAIAVLMAGWKSTAAAEGWSWRNWVPFAKKEPETSKKTKSTSSGMFFDRRPLKGSNSRRSSENDSALSRAGSSTKRFFSKTTDRLTFRKIKPQRQPVSGMSGSYDFRKKPEKKRSFFTSWFRDDSESDPRTPQEWQSLQRPSP